MKRRTDRDVLCKSIERRFRHAMVRILDEYDTRHPGDIESDRGRLFKIDVKNMLNDMIRSTSSEMGDYDIGYRPVRVNPDGQLSLTRTFISTLQRVEFTSTPSVRFVADKSNKGVLQSLRDELGAGVLYFDEDDCLFEVVGPDACVNCALPFLDRYRLHKDVAEAYQGWRREVVAAYIGDR